MNSGTQSPAGGEAAVVGPVAAPNDVRASFVLWLAAVAAGVFETILAIIEVVSGQLALGTGGVIVGVSMRLLIFTVVVYVASRMLRGRNWARFVLAIGLGVLGTLSIVIGPVSWLVEGHTIGEFVAGADLMLLLFASSRVVHLIAVFAALVLMFRPAANDYFRAARSARRLAPGRTVPDRVGAQVAICRESACPTWRAWTTPPPPRNSQRTGEPGRQLEMTAFTQVRGR